MFGLNCHGDVSSRFSHFLRREKKGWWDPKGTNKCKKTRILGTMSLTLSWLFECIFRHLVRPSRLSRRAAIRSTATRCAVSPSNPFPRGDSHDLNKLPLGSYMFDVNLYKRHRATWKKTESWKQTVKATFAVGLRAAVQPATGSAESYEWLQSHLIVYFSRMNLRSLIQALPCLGCDLLQRLNPKRGQQRRTVGNHKSHGLSADQRSAVQKCGVSLKSIWTHLLYHKDDITIYIAECENIGWDILCIWQMRWQRRLTIV